MSVFTRENTELAVELDDLGQQHRGEAGGMVIALERWMAGLDTAEMFADLPGGACQEPHFGYVLEGAVPVRYSDGATERLEKASGQLPAPGPQRAHRRGFRVRRVHPGERCAGQSTRSMRD